MFPHSFARFTLSIIALLIVPLSQVHAKNHWTVVFQKHFQTVISGLSWMQPTPTVQASVIDRDENFVPLLPTLSSQEPTVIEAELEVVESEVSPGDEASQEMEVETFISEKPQTGNIMVLREGTSRPLLGKPYIQKPYENKDYPEITAKSDQDIVAIKDLKIAQEPLTRYLDFVVPQALITSIIETTHEKGSQSAIFKADDMKGITHTVTHPQLRSQGIRELIGVGVSNFAHSTSERRHNIFNAITKFDGHIIPQGTTFSFNDILKNAGPSNGFMMAKIISNGMTKWGWGGGVCQLSTTVFRSAYNAGLPMVDRRNHTFQVVYYGREKEEQGMDATIYLGGQDLQFTNDTPGDIMMQIIERDENLMVLFYGTKDREVQLTGPSIDGLNYKWFRTTVFRDQSVKEETLASYYRPEIKPVVESPSEDDVAQEADGSF